MEQDRLYGDLMEPCAETMDLKYLQYRRGMSINVTGHEYCVCTMFDISGLCVEGGKSVMHFFLRRNNRGGFSPYINENDENWIRLRNERNFPVYRVCNAAPLDTAVDGCCVFCFVYGKERFRNVPVVVKQMVYRDKESHKVDHTFVFGVCRHCNDPRNFEFLDTIVGQHLNHRVFSYHVYDTDTRAKPRDYSTSSRIDYTPLASLEDGPFVCSKRERPSGPSVGLPERGAKLSRRVDDLEAFIGKVTTLVMGQEDRLHEVKASLGRFMRSYCRAPSNTEGPGIVPSNTVGPGLAEANTEGPGLAEAITEGPGLAEANTEGPGIVPSNTEGPGAGPAEY